VKTIDRLIYREFFPNFIVGLLFFSFVLFLVTLYGLIELIVEKGAPPLTILNLSAHLVPSVIILSIPMSQCVCLLYSYGRLSQDNEIMALLTGGVPLSRIMRPIQVVGGMFCVVVFGLYEWALPWGNLGAQEIIVDLAMKKPTIKIPKGEFYRFNDRLFYVRDFGDSRDIMKDVYIFRSENRGGKDMATLLHAETAFTRSTGHEESPSTPTAPEIPKEGLVLYLNDGEIARFERRGSDFALGKFKEGELFLDTQESRRYGGVNMSPRETGFIALYRQVKKIKERGGDAKYYELELWKKIAIPMACIIFSFFAPLAVRHRRTGKATGIGFSVLIITIYYFVLELGYGAARAGAISAVSGAFLANFLSVILALGIYAGPRVIQFNFRRKGA